MPGIRGAALQVEGIQGHFIRTLAVKLKLSALIAERTIRSEGVR